MSKETTVVERSNITMPEGTDGVPVPAHPPIIAGYVHREEGIPQPIVEDVYARFAQDLHAFVREMVQRADQKAAFFSAASTTLLAFLYKQNFSAGWLAPLPEWSLVDIVAFVAMLALGVTSLLSLAVVLPRNRGPLKGHIFWRAIAEHESGDAFAAEVMGLDENELTREKLMNVHAISRSCTRKYDILRYAMWSGALGLVAAVLLLLLAKAGAVQ